MNVDKLENVGQVMRLVQEDCEAEGTSTRAIPFTGRGVGEQLGNMLAEIKAVAWGVEVLAEVLIEQARGS